MKRNSPTDKDLRLYTRLSDIDGDLVLDSAIPVGTAPTVVHHPKWEAFKDLLSRPWAASLAVSAAMLVLVLAALLVMGLADDPANEPPAHGSYPSEQPPVWAPPVVEKPVTPTLENAAALRKGMTFAELTALMGNTYTQDGDRYTFTLDTGEELTVTTVSNEAGETTVTGFAWLGEAAKAYNPLDIPADILQKLQNYATDKAFPVYAMDSLIGKYSKNLAVPSVEEVLEGAELCYLLVGADGETVITNEEGHSAGGSSQSWDYSLLDDVSSLFDDSVRIRAYYPIMTSREREAIYFCTSVGDYVLYLHGETLLDLIEGADPSAADLVPYLLPVSVFNRFAHGMEDKSMHYGIGWDFTEERMDTIAPYELGSEGYRKPVNLATPEAAAQIKSGMTPSALEELLGSCLRCATVSPLAVYARTSVALPYYTDQGLHYWELTDGRGLVVSTRMTENYSGIGSVHEVSLVLYTDSADVLYEMGTLSTATVSLLRKDMSLYAVNAILGSSCSNVINEPTVLWWHEDGVAHTCTLTWKIYETDGTVPIPMSLLDTYTHSTRTMTEAAEEIKVGMSFPAITARLEGCLCGHEADKLGEVSTGFHYWTLPDGRCLAIYMGYDIPAEDRLYSFTSSKTYSMTSMKLLWLSSLEQAETVGVPGLSMAEQVKAGMKEEVVIALMGQPTVTADSLFSAWEWSEGGKTYTYIVYWKNLLAASRNYPNFNVVARGELLEGGLMLPIPDQIPTPADAAKATEGMTASELLRTMGRGATVSSYLHANLYTWSLTDGRVFCALAERDPSAPDTSEWLVTYTFYRDSMEDVSIPTQENMEAVIEGMSIATIYALLGNEPYRTNILSNATWCTPNDFSGEITVNWTVKTHPETGIEYAYATSVTLDKITP